MSAVPAQRRADVIAALTANDVRAMDGHEITSFILDGLSPAQMCSMLRFLSGYTPDGFALAVRGYIDPEQFAPAPEAAP